MTRLGDWEGDANGLVLAVFVNLIVHAKFVVGKWGFTSPAVGQHLEAFVDQALFVELFESPEHALGVVGVQSLVVVIKINPTCLTGYVGAPVFGVLQNRGLAKLVELCNAELFDLRSTGDAKQSLSLNLCGKTVSVPTKATLNAIAAHGLVPGD